MGRSHLIVVVGVAVIASAAFAGTARGDGLPMPFERTQAGVTVPGGESRYTTIPAGADTIVARTAIDGGEIERWRRLPGVLTVPAVAYDGSASGLAADGERLVLIRPRRTFPRARTSFAVLHPASLRIQRRITIKGDFSFDAISPDGRRMYLVEYLDPRDPTAYQVRGYDLERERLDREPIVDPDVAPVTMGGAPQTRAMSPDGVWAYTLYDTLDRARPPFIHALNTRDATAACILLDDGIVNRSGLHRMRLEPSGDGATLAVVDRHDPVALVDTDTFEVTEPSPAAPPEAASGGPDWLPWALLGLGALAVTGLARRAAHLKRRSRKPSAGELESLRRLGAKAAPPARCPEPDGPGSRGKVKERNPAA